MNVLQVPLSAAVGVLLLLLGCTALVEPGRTGAEPLPPLVAQRVTATIQREALRLVRLETEHEAFLTTPEHPFATPRSGWIRAGRLVPGDWVVSERFGAVRLLSVRAERAARPVPVFNLSVASSHAYFVGADRVLVHNTKCTPNESESREDFIARLVRMRDELNRQIKELNKTTPGAPRLAELKIQRDQLQRQIDGLRTAQRKKDRRGVPPPSTNERAQQHFEADDAAARKALDGAKRELADLESQPPTSQTDKTSPARKKKLEKQIRSLQFNYDRTQRILKRLRELAELEKDLPATATDAERRAREERKKALRAELEPERKRAKHAKNYGKERADPKRREERTEYHRNLKRRERRLAPYLADTARPRDPLELLEAELAGRLQEAPSESRDARIHHLTEQIETLKRQVEVRKESGRLMTRRHRARLEREKLIAQGKDTSDVDRALQQLEAKLHALRIELAQLRVWEQLLAVLDEAPSAHAPGPADEAQLREFERQLAGGSVDDEQLARIEAALDAMDPTDPDWQQAWLEEAHDVDENLREWEELLRQNPSAERAAGLQSSLESLQRELREERGAFEAALFALVNEHAAIENTRASSSSGASWEQRLRDNEAEMLELRARRRARLSERLESARQQLDLMRRMPRFHDEASEVALARQIALLERELQDAGG